MTELTAASIIRQELDVYFTMNMNDQKIMARLREKYSDEDLRRAIFEAYKSRQDFIQRKAIMFKELIFKHCPNLLIGVGPSTVSTASRTVNVVNRGIGNSLNLSDDEIFVIKKAKKYQSRLELTDSEFVLLVNLVLQ